MKYVIEEEELKDFAIKCVNDDGVGELSIDVRIQDLTQSKTPVEEIADGEVKDNSLLPGVVSYKIGDIDDIKIFYNIYNRQNKNIKIYIEVIK